MDEVKKPVIVAWITKGQFDTHIGLTEFGKALKDGRYELSVTKADLKYGEIYEQAELS